MSITKIQGSANIQKNTLPKNMNAASRAISHNQTLSHNASNIAFGMSLNRYLEGTTRASWEKNLAFWREKAVYWYTKRLHVTSEAGIISAQRNFDRAQRNITISEAALMEFPKAK